MASEACTTWALIRLVARMNFCMSLQVVLADKALATAIALELAISKMCLNVRTDVLSSAENFAAILVETRPLVGDGILLANVALDLFRGNSSILQAGIDLKVIKESGLLELVGKGQAVHCHGCVR